MPRVNIVKQVNLDGRWRMRSIPRKPSGGYDWNTLPDGRYYVEWYENGKRCRLPGGKTAAEALEAQRRKRHELEGRKLGVPGFETVDDQPKRKLLAVLVHQYLDQVATLKKPNTHRKYKAVLERFSAYFPKRTLESISAEDLNRYVMALKKDLELSSNTVLHNVIIIAQLFRRFGRAGITRELQLPEKVTSLPRKYADKDLAKFFGVCNEFEKPLYSTFLLTGLREQEVMYLFWTDVNLKLRTICVTAKPDLGFYPKRWEEREVPISVQLVELLTKHPHHEGSLFVFPSPTGNREQHMLDHCKEIAARAELDTSKFDLKTFRSTYATRMLREGFDVRTVQHWMGHKSLETTMRYLVPASDVHTRLDQVSIPGSAAISKS